MNKNIKNLVFTAFIAGLGLANTGCVATRCYGTYPAAHYEAACITPPVVETIYEPVYVETPVVHTVHTPPRPPKPRMTVRPEPPRKPAPRPQAAARQSKPLQKAPARTQAKARTKAQTKTPTKHPRQQAKPAPAPRKPAARTGRKG